MLYVHKILKKIYNWCFTLMQGKYAFLALLIIAFIESSFFPIPPDIFLIPLLLANQKKAFSIAFWVTTFSVLGGAFGYFIGFFLYQSVGLPLLEMYHAVAKFEKFCSYYNEWGSLIVFGAGLTPFPYKVVTIASGVAKMNFLTFMIASFISRGLRFFIIAWLIYKYGKPMQTFIEKNLGFLTIILMILVLAIIFIFL